MTKKEIVDHADFLGSLSYLIANAATASRSDRASAISDLVRFSYESAYNDKREGRVKVNVKLDGWEESAA